MLYAWGFPGGTSGKEPACNVGDTGLIPGLGKSPGGGNGNPLQYSCLENPMDRRAWQATIHRVTLSRTELKQLSTGQHPCSMPTWLRFLSINRCWFCQKPFLHLLKWSCDFYSPIFLNSQCSFINICVAFCFLKIAIWRVTFF